MVTTFNKTGAPDAEKSAQDGQQNAEQAVNTRLSDLNRPGFAEFLGRHPQEQVKLEDDSYVANRVEVFENLQSAKEEIKAQYEGILKSKFGFELQADGQAVIEDHIENMAINSPKEFGELRQRISAFKELPLHIKALNEQIAQMGSKEGLEGNVERWTADLAEMKADGQHRVSMLNYLTGSVQYANQLGDKIQLATETLGKLNEASDLKAQTEEIFGKLSVDVERGISSMPALVASIQSRVEMQMQELTQGKGLEDLQKAQDRLVSIKTAVEGSGLEFNPLGNVDSGQLEATLDKSIQEAAQNEILNVIKKEKLSGANPLDRLEKALKGFLAKGKFGTKEGAEARSAILDTMKKAAENLPNDTEGRAKKVLISGIIIRNRATATN